MKLIDVVHSKDKSWLHLDTKGTHMGEFLGIKATGNEVKYEQVVMVTFGENSKIKELKIINDSLTIFQQLGQAIIKKDDQLQITQYLNSLRSIGLLPQGE
jgi:hypothetical protein